MIKTALITAALCAAVVGCGGVPGNAVATVDGESIDKADFTHWVNIINKSTSGTTKPDAKAVKEQALQLLLEFRWIQGEAAQQHVAVTDADVKKAFTTQKQQAFPKDADYQTFLKQSGETEADILKRVKLDLLSGKIRDKVVKGSDAVSTQAIASFYNKNKASMVKPETRDLRVEMSKTEAAAKAAEAKLRSGGGKKVAGQAKGSLDPTLDSAVFAAKPGEVTGPVKASDGYYDFVVTKVNPASPQSLAEASASIKQTLVAQAQQKKLNAFTKDFTTRWRAKTECSETYKTSDCKNGPKPTPTPTATVPPVATQ